MRAYNHRSNRPSNSISNVEFSYECFVILYIECSIHGNQRISSTRFVSIWKSLFMIHTREKGAGFIMFCILAYLAFFWCPFLNLKLIYNKQKRSAKYRKENMGKKVRRVELFWHKMTFYFFSNPRKMCSHFSFILLLAQEVIDSRKSVKQGVIPEALRNWDGTWRQYHILQ